MKMLNIWKQCDEYKNLAKNLNVKHWLIRHLLLLKKCGFTCLIAKSFIYF